MTAPTTTAAAVEELARDVAELARPRARTDLADRLASELAREDTGTARVVVVGEANRGKSSVVNALVGSSDLSPVAPDIATSCHIVIRGDASERAVVHRRDGSAHEIPFAAIAEYATAAGGASGSVQAVDVTLDSPLLRRGLTLVDTPGVGGLVAGHAAITRAALVDADALLFVLDAESEVGHHEIEFLKQVSERVGTVIFAFNKIDDYPAWRKLLESTRARLPARFAEDPIIGVSSERRQQAERVRAGGDDERATELQERSGFSALEAELEQNVLGRARELRLWNLLAVCRTALAELERPDEAVAMVSDPGLAERLRAAVENLKELKATTHAIAQDVTLDLEQLRLTISTEYDRRTVELERQYARRIAEWDDEFADQFAARLQSDLDALAGALNTMLLEGIADIDERLVARVGVTESSLAVGPDAQQIALPDLLPTRADPAASAKIRRTQLLMMGGLGGGRLAAFGGEAAAGLVATAAIGTLTAGLAVAGAVVGLALAGLASRRIERNQGRGQAQQQAGRLVSDAISEARVQLHSPLSTRLLTLRREFQADVDLRLKDREARLLAEQTRLQSLSAEDSGRRQAAERAAKDRLAELKPLQDRLAGLLDDLRNGAVI